MNDLTQNSNHKKRIVLYCLMVVLALVAGILWSYSNKKQAAPTDITNNSNQSTGISNEGAIELAKQEIINYCCNLHSINRVSISFDYTSVERNDEDDLVITLTGQYRPIDDVIDRVGEKSFFYFAVCLDKYGNTKWCERLS